MNLGENARLLYVNNTLHICNSKSLSPNKKIEGKYGVEVWYDIEGTPTSISIPEPDVLFGIDEDFFKQFG